MWDTMGELLVQTRNATTFRCNILCVLTLVTRKLQVVCWRSTYPMTALLSEMSIFCVRGGYKIRMARCASKRTSQSLSGKPFCVYSALRHITWKLQAICGILTYWTTARCILSETLFGWFRFALEIQLECYGPRHALVVLWHGCVCVYCKSVYTSLFGTQLSLTTKLTYLMTAYHTQNDGFTTSDASFLRTKLASYTTRCSVFSINCLHYY